MEAKRRKLDEESSSTPTGNTETPAEVGSAPDHATATTVEVKNGQYAAKCVSEADVGITEFVNTTSKGFNGLIKQRYSDFQVNEITRDGEVSHLKRIEEPVKEEPAKPSSRAQETDVKPNEHTQKLAELTNPDFVEKCFQLLKDPDAPRARYDQMVDKAARSEIHASIREGFDSRLESRTDEGKISVSRMNKRSRVYRGTTQSGRPPKQAEYLYFTSYKENKDTMEAVSTIAKFMRVPPKSITFAGTKDRRAATTQRACWRRGNPQRLAGLNGAFKSGNIRIGDFSYESQTSKLGDSSGNQFGIVIRNCDGSALSEINESLASSRDQGFINYFGSQRFGTFSVSSHTTGRSISREDFDAAVQGISNPQDITIADSKEAREVWAKTGDAAEASKSMPRRCVAETAILTALVESPNSSNALMRVPHSSKIMYVHAYQSYVWNRAASERISRSRKHALVGDLVWGGVNEAGRQEARPIKTQTEADTFSIYDVISPMPGNDVTYPENMVAFYEDLMAVDGINCHDMQRKIKEFSVYGSYRTLITRPSFLEWTSRQYIKDDATILYTDREALEHGGEKSAPEDTVSTESPDLTQKVAIVLTMGSSTAQYATMALREAMKKETSRNGEIYFG